MALTVEDGTGVSGAVTYYSVANIDTYCANLGLTSWASETTSSKEAAVYRAMAFLDSIRWFGSKSDDTNDLAWPRLGAVDREGNLYSSTEIPAALINSLCEAAYIESGTAGTLQPTVDMTDQVKSKKVDVLGKEYFAPGSNVKRTAGKEFNRLFGYLRGMGEGWPFNGTATGGSFEAGRG